MNNQIFFQAISNFDNGQVNFNLGENWSFLFNQKWYPTRAFMRHYLEIAERPNDNVNLHQSVFELSKFISIYSSEINYVEHRPVNI
jgi:hypothetical protein